MLLSSVQILAILCIALHYHQSIKGVVFVEGFGSSSSLSLSLSSASASASSYRRVAESARFQQNGGRLRSAVQKQYQQDYGRSLRLRLRLPTLLFVSHANKQTLRRKSNNNNGSTTSSSSLINDNYAADDNDILIMNKSPSSSSSVTVDENISDETKQPQQQSQQ